MPEHKITVPFPREGSGIEWVTTAYPEGKVPEGCAACPQYQLMVEALLACGWKADPNFLIGADRYCGYWKGPAGEIDRMPHGMACVRMYGWLADRIGQVHSAVQAANELGIDLAQMIKAEIELPGIKATTTSKATMYRIHCDHVVEGLEVLNEWQDQAPPTRGHPVRRLLRFARTLCAELAELALGDMLANAAPNLIGQTMLSHFHTGVICPHGHCSEVVPNSEP